MEDNFGHFKSLMNLEYPKVSLEQVFDSDAQASLAKAFGLEPLSRRISLPSLM